MQNFLLVMELFMVEFFLLLVLSLTTPQLLVLLARHYIFSRYSFICMWMHKKLKKDSMWVICVASCDLRPILKSAKQPHQSMTGRPLLFFSPSHQANHGQDPAAESASSSSSSMHWRHQVSLMTLTASKPTYCTTG